MPTLAFLPAELIITLDDGNSGQAKIWVSNVTNMNAFDIILEYDSSVVTLTDYTFGGFVSVDHCFREINTPGSLRLACMQFNTGNSGSGSLVDLTFEAHGAGSTEMTFTRADLSSLGGVPINVDVYDGLITARYQTISVLGTLRMQGRTVTAGVPVILTSAGFVPLHVVTVDAISNNLAVIDIPKATYTFTTTQSGYLNPSAQMTLNADLTLPPLHLLAGDVNADDAVDTADLDAIGAVFGAPGSGLAADLNGDGVVNLQDLALAAGNYGLTPAEAYDDWLP